MDEIYIYMYIFQILASITKNKETPAPHKQPPSKKAKCDHTKIYFITLLYSSLKLH